LFFVSDEQLINDMCVSSTDEVIKIK